MDDFTRTKKKIPRVVRLIAAVTTFFLLGTHVYAQNYNMGNGTINACSGNFFDSQGGAANYLNNQNLTYTICPGAANQ